MPDDYVAQVLGLVERIPRGRVMTYGDVARVVARSGPRQVGTVLAQFGGGVPWWRVLRAGGLPPSGLEVEALVHYREEGTPLVAQREQPRVDLRRAHWTPLP